MTAAAPSKAPGVTFAVVRIRGHVHIRRRIDATLRLLSLTRANHCVLVPDTPHNRGMIQKVKDYVTWGEIDGPTLEKVLGARGKFQGNVPLTDAELARRKAGYPTIQGLAGALLAGKTRMADIENLKPVLRLHPPLKGWGTVKRSVGNQGVLGYRGAAINTLLLRMLGPARPPAGAKLKKATKQVKPVKTAKSVKPVKKEKEKEKKVATKEA